MSFISLQLGEHLPENVQKLIEWQIKMQFEDIHALLRLPLDDLNGIGGCNYVTANALLSLMSGFSVLTTPRLDTERNSRAEFKNTMRKYFPWDMTQAITRNEQNGFIDDLYNLFRNSLTHSLGINKRGSRYGSILKNSMPENEIEDLEKALDCPGPPFVYLSNRSRRRGARVGLDLRIPSFYWCVRKMFYNMTNDRELMEQLEKAIQDKGILEMLSAELR